MSAGFRRNNIIMIRFRTIKEERIIIEMIPKMILTCRFKAFFPWQKNALTFSQRIFILEFIDSKYGNDKRNEN